MFSPRENVPGVCSKKKRLGNIFSRHLGVDSPILFVDSLALGVVHGVLYTQGRIFFYYISCVTVIFSSRVHLFTSLPVSGKSSSNNNTDSDGANLDKQIKITHQTTTPKACKMKTYILEIIAELINALEKSMQNYDSLINPE